MDYRAFRTTDRPLLHMVLGHRIQGARAFYDAETGDLRFVYLAQLGTPIIGAIAFSPDGKIASR